MPEHHAHRRTVTCAICKHQRRMLDARIVEAIRPGVLEMLLAKYPALKPSEYVCRADLKPFRRAYIEKMLAAEKGELSSLDREVIKSMVEHETVARNINAQSTQKITFGENLSDKLASFGGSWRFLIFFGIVLVVWIGVNAFVLINKPFDPFPFILLNLILSCLAAIQAPVIMMSQNRKDAKDRLRSENDYKVNLKAELQIRQLHEKIDYLTSQQWQRLIEIQKLQLELLEGKKGRK